MVAKYKFKPANSDMQHFSHINPISFFISFSFSIAKLDSMRKLPNTCCVCNQHLFNNTVILLCDCIIAICQSCAKKQISLREGTYESSIVCPVCNFATSTDRIIEGVMEAKQMENELILSASSYFKVRPPTKKKKNYLQLMEKFSVLGNGNIFVGIDGPIDDCVLKLRIAQLESLRQEQFNFPSKLVESSDYLPEGPLSKIHFKNNSILEKVIAICEQNVDSDLSEACIVCNELIRAGQSVQFLCPCVVNILCNNCALQTIANQEETYLGGISCPTCRQTSQVIGGVSEAKKVEMKLVTDGMRHFKMRNLKGRTKNFDQLHKLYVDYYHAGYKGSINPDHYMTETPGLSKPCTVAIIRLEIARLELLRVNNEQNNPDPSNLHRYLGPLSIITIKRNKFLEAFLLNYCAAPSSFDATDQMKPSVSGGSIAVGGHQWLDQKVFNSDSSDHLSEDDNSGAENSTTDYQQANIITSTMLRTKSTPCSYCSLDPHSFYYLQMHIRSQHQLSQNAAISAGGGTLLLSTSSEGEDGQETMKMVSSSSGIRGKGFVVVSSSNEEDGFYDPTEEDSSHNQSSAEDVDKDDGLRRYYQTNDSDSDGDGADGESGPDDSSAHNNENDSFTENKWRRGETTFDGSQQTNDSDLDDSVSAESGPDDISAHNNENDSFTENKCRRGGVIFDGSQQQQQLTFESAHDDSKGCWVNSNKNVRNTTSSIAVLDDCHIPEDVQYNCQTNLAARKSIMPLTADPTVNTTTFSETSINLLFDALKFTGGYQIIFNDKSKHNRSFSSAEVKSGMVRFAFRVYLDSTAAESLKHQIAKSYRFQSYKNAVEIEDGTMVLQTTLDVFTRKTRLEFFGTLLKTQLAINARVVDFAKKSSDRHNIILPRKNTLEECDIDGKFVLELRPIVNNHRKTVGTAFDTILVQQQVGWNKKLPNNRKHQKRLTNLEVAKERATNNAIPTIASSFAVADEQKTLRYEEELESGMMAADSSEEQQEEITTATTVCRPSDIQEHFYHDDGGVHKRSTSSNNNDSSEMISKSKERHNKSTPSFCAVNNGFRDDPYVMFLQTADAPNDQIHQQNNSKSLEFTVKIHGCLLEDVSDNRGIATMTLAVSANRPLSSLIPLLDNGIGFKTLVAEFRSVQGKFLQRNRSFSEYNVLSNTIIELRPRRDTNDNNKKNHQQAITISSSSASNKQTNSSRQTLQSPTVSKQPRPEKADEKKCDNHDSSRPTSISTDHQQSQHFDYDNVLNRQTVEESGDSSGSDESYDAFGPKRKKKFIKRRSATTTKKTTNREIVSISQQQNFSVRHSAIPQQQRGQVGETCQYSMGDEQRLLNLSQSDESGSSSVEKKKRHKRLSSNSAATKTTGYKSGRF